MIACLCGKVVIMNNYKAKGNHKHLTLSDRIKIEYGLNQGISFNAIAKELHKDPSTISKEVRLHSQIKERPKSIQRFPVPCENNHDNAYPGISICDYHNVCGEGCSCKCVNCRKYRCAEVCPHYTPRICTRLTSPPYVCNGCKKNGGCLLERKYYSSKYAQDEYERLLSEARAGINQTPEEIQNMNDIVSPLLKKGQSLAHIYATHAEELGCSRRTMYKYIAADVFDVCNLDLRRKVRYKKRKKRTQTSIKDRSYRIGHTYEDFCRYVEEKKPLYIVEMDTVEGAKGTKACFLTMLFRNCNLMLMFLLEEQSQEEVQRIFDYLNQALGIELFQKLFQVILTDNGHEFQNRLSLECDENGEIRTKIFYCDPRHSEQKGALEKNHEYIRYVIPKGKSLEFMDEAKTLLLLNHINSEKRDSLNGHSPYEVSRLLLDNRLHKALGLAEIPADDVTLNPSLLK